MEIWPTDLDFGILGYDFKVPIGGSIKNNPEDFVVTEIADQGEGISNYDQKKIFKLFERPQKETQYVKGFGIGLVVCQRLVEAQGGWIKVDSEVGRGSTFSFALPIYDKNK